MRPKLIEASKAPGFFDEKFRETRRLIESGETHLDNLAEGFTEAWRVIPAMPDEDAKPVVHAQWNEWWPGDCALIMTGEEMLYQCSACTAKYSDIEGYRYCPNCGAMMDL